MSDILRKRARSPSRKGDAGQPTCLSPMPRPSPIEIGEGVPLREPAAWPGRGSREGADRKGGRIEAVLLDSTLPPPAAPIRPATRPFAPTPVSLFRSTSMNDIGSIISCCGHAGKRFLQLRQVEPAPGERSATASHASATVDAGSFQFGRVQQRVLPHHQEQLRLRPVARQQLPSVSTVYDAPGSASLSVDTSKRGAASTARRVIASRFRGAYLPACLPPRLARRHEQQLVQRQVLDGGFRQPQVPNVGRVERAAENALVHPSHSISTPATRIRSPSRTRASQRSAHAHSHQSTPYLRLRLTRITGQSLHHALGQRLIHREHAVYLPDEARLPRLQLDDRPRRRRLRLRHRLFLQQVPPITVSISASTPSPGARRDEQRLDARRRQREAHPPVPVAPLDVHLVFTATTCLFRASASVYDASSALIVAMSSIGSARVRDRRGGLHPRPRCGQGTPGPGRRPRAPPR